MALHRQREVFVQEREKAKPATSCDNNTWPWLTSPHRADDFIRKTREAWLSIKQAIMNACIPIQEAQPQRIKT